MVAARGYGLADAFLLAAIAVPVWHRLKGQPSLRTCCVLASLALGLSFAANFSFAFVDATTFLAILLWAIPRRGEESIARIVEFCVLPGQIDLRPAGIVLPAVHRCGEGGGGLPRQINRRCCRSETTGGLQITPWQSIT
jgi:hypothetical protein